MVLSSRITGQLGNNKKGFPYFITKKNIFFYQKTENMIYCIEVNRSGIGEENITLHHKFEK